MENTLCTEKQPFLYESDPVTHRNNSGHRDHSDVLCPLLQTRHMYECTVKKLFKSVVYSLNGDIFSSYALTQADTG